MASFMCAISQVRMSSRVGYFPFYSIVQHDVVVFFSTPPSVCEASFVVA